MFKYELKKNFAYTGVSLMHCFSLVSKSSEPGKLAPFPSRRRHYVSERPKRAFGVKK